MIAHQNRPVTMKHTAMPSSTIAMRRSYQRGMTLIELTLTLVIGGVIMAAAVSYGSTVMSQSRISDEGSRLNALAGRIESAFVGRKANFGLLSSNGNAFVVANIGLQGVFGINGSSITGSFGDITIGAGSDGPSAAANSSYTVTYGPALSKADCIGLVANASGAFKVVRVGSTVVKAANVNNPDLALTTTACTAGGALSFSGYAL